MYSHCPKCGTSYENEAHSTAPHCTQCNFVFYVDTKPTSSVIITDNGRVLLGKRAIQPSKGKWDVIGGFLNFGEHPEVGALREAKEETGYDVQIERMLGIFMDTYETTGAATLNICYVAKIIGGTPKPGDDIEELHWFSPADIPSEIAYKNGRDMLDVWIKLAK